MSRLLLVAESSPPEPHRSAMRERIAAFCAALREAGHTVSLAPAAAGSEADATPPARSADSGAHVVEAKMGSAMAVAWDGVIAAGPPDALSRGARMADSADVPLWLDIDAAVPAIIDSRPDAQADLTWALARADRLSAPHARLEEILLGQLGFVGRLNRLTIGEPLTVVIAGDGSSDDLTPILTWAMAPEFAADRKALGRRMPLNTLHGVFQKL